ncbi:glycosyltransferase family protein [Alteribacter natronophilus]|uniref:glycosyltransferase family protein n=1 Tax=Alteribacter natronophilus TaxID=2583810 RepID=UPI00110E4D41|nr:glycosyltransferase [Alteribacter natronophilus]TMW72954.1 hypothetical protein FGB90_01190 [Alteribacter natronophilus]
MKKIAFLVCTDYGFPVYSAESVCRSLKNTGCSVMPLDYREDDSTLQQQIEMFSPAAVFMILSGTEWGQIVSRLSDLKIPLIGWITDDPICVDYSRRFIHYFHTVYTTEKNASFVYRGLGHRRTAFLPHCADPGLYYHDPRESSVYHSDVCTVLPPSSLLMEYITFLLDYTDWTIQTVGKGWHEALAHRIPQPKLKVVNYWVPPRIARHFYSSAKVSLTLSHRDNPSHNQTGIPAGSPSHEVFAAGACRGFQLTSRRRENSGLFSTPFTPLQVGSREETLALISHYLTDDRTRELSAEACFNEIMNRNTLDHRIKYVITHLDSEEIPHYN